jgi:hypothetical protein
MTWRGSTDQQGRPVIGSVSEARGDLKAMDYFPEAARITPEDAGLMKVSIEPSRRK